MEVSLWSVLRTLLLYAKRHPQQALERAALVAMALLVLHLLLSPSASSSSSCYASSSSSSPSSYSSWPSASSFPQDQTSEGWVGRLDASAAAAAGPGAAAAAAAAGSAAGLQCSNSSGGGCSNVGLGEGLSWEQLLQPRMQVYPAPDATMGNLDLATMGQMAHHEDGRGSIIRISLGAFESPQISQTEDAAAEVADDAQDGSVDSQDLSVSSSSSSSSSSSREGDRGSGGRLGVPLVVNLMRTKPGVLRSGDVHNCTQYDVVLFGRTRLRLMDMRTGVEVVREYRGANDFIAIPPRVPHIFEFLEENAMIEWWDCEFRAWHYKPYRDLIQRSIALASKDQSRIDNEGHV